MNALHDLRLVRPSSIDDAVRALAEDGARPLAGGTDLLPNLRRGLGEPRKLVDLGAIAGLAAIESGADGGLRLGAGVTLAALAGDERVRSGWPALAHAAGLVAGPTHRATATLGGNLCQDTRCIFYNQSDWWRAGNGYCLKYRGDKCHVVVKSDRCYATYHGDVAPALIVLGAAAEIAGPGGRRTIPLADLFVEDGACRLTLEAGEWLTGVAVPPPGRWRAAYEKARVRDAVDFPLAGIAVAMERDGDRIAGLRVAITGTNSAPLVVPTDALVGAVWDAAAAQALEKAVRATSNVLATTVATVRYRRRVLQALTRKLASELWAGSDRAATPTR
ncbi:MAG TPA: 4-hydroxybenzoyl-CoA reductase subunit beta [Burkholderiaceae bacterium]|nr:4-hydroxybenzoyl-CoA reductase subunit beta [Burkholderiaceae bacterium]